MNERLPPGGGARPAPQPAPGKTDVKTPAPARIPVAAPSVVIRGVRFEGAAPPAPVAAAAERFLGAAASQETLEAMTAAMSDAYGRSDIAFHTILVPEQDFPHGIVRVLVAEGWIESVTLTGDTEEHDHALLRAYGEKLTAENPTRRRTFERYRALIAEIPGLEADAALQFGAEPGALRLVMDLDHKRPTAAFGFTNRTSRLVRDGQLTAEGKAYGFLREGDETRLNLASSVNFRDSHYVSLQHSTPLLREGARLDIGGAWLRSEPAGGAQRGEAVIVSLGASYPLICSRRRDVTLRLSGDALNSENAAFGSLIATERTRTLRFAAGYAVKGEKRVTTLKATVAKGVDAMGASVTAPLGQPDFFKMSAEATVAQALSPRSLVRVSAAGQWTDDRLPANERFTVGGADFGRAFENGLVSGDRGFAASIEPAFRPLRSGRFSKSEIYAFADYAQTNLLAREGLAETRYGLGSVGGGVRAAFSDKAMLEIEVATPWDRPVEAYDEGWRVFARWRVDIRP